MIFRSRYLRVLNQEREANFRDTRSIHGLLRLGTQLQVLDLSLHHHTMTFIQLKILLN
jgi:hypothetical protein